MRRYRHHNGIRGGEQPYVVHDRIYVSTQLCNNNGMVQRLTYSFDAADENSVCTLGRFKSNAVYLSHNPHDHNNVLKNVQAFCEDFKVAKKS